MPRVVFVEAGGQRREFTARVGQSLMEVGRDHDVRGIIAECGGACACGTCHVKVDEKWRAVVGPASEVEVSMLDFTQDAGPESRLSCQIPITEDLDGLVVYVPQE
jgi:ferredoxin, 2Fe-2S